MYVECPECKSCFMIRGKRVPANVAHFRCGVCKNVFVLNRKDMQSQNALLWKTKIFFRRFGKKLLITFSLLLMFFICIVAFWAAKDDLAGKYPFIRNGLSALGISGDSYAVGLDFENVQQKITIDDKGNNQILEISGLIVNHRQKNMEVPAVQVVIYDKAGDKMESKIIYPQDRSLRPMEKARFRIKTLISEDSDFGNAKLNFVKK